LPGYNVEYSSVVFALFFIGEYLHIIFMSTLGVILFFGGWQSPDSLFEKTLLLLSTPVVVWLPEALMHIYIHIDTVTNFEGLVDLFHSTPVHYLYLSGNTMFMIKTSLLISLFVLARIALPRFRYDQLMRLGWKVLLPIAFSTTLITAAILKITGKYPPIKG